MNKLIIPFILFFLTVSDFTFGGSRITADGDCSHEIKRRFLLGSKVMTNLDSIFKSRHHFANKGLPSQGYGFSYGHVCMWELDCEESWAPKNWCFRTVVLKILKSPLDCKEVKPVNPRWNQPWIFNGKTDAEAEALILWPPDVKNWFTGKDPDARQCINKQRHHFADKGLCSQSYVFVFVF